jgi:N-acetylated-alpha-linked acidic dipeptidase
VSTAQEAPLLGFTKESSAKQRELEQKLIGQPSGERMKVYHRALTAKPHHAGTKANEETAEYYADRLREFGFDEILMNRYEALLPRPVTREVTLLEPERYELKLAEPEVPFDPDSGQEGVLPTFNAYAADGDVTAEVVYVNYGIPADYEVLDSLGIPVEGKIVIARYGKSWRGIKPRLAAERGAIGCLLYSDPADDGYFKGDVLPDGKWRPEFGVQRGSVMDMPTYPGDPQTPMRPSKKGVQRIPLEEVPTLQKIPVLPISYADALPILRNLKGEVVPEGWRGNLAITYHFGPGPAKVRLRLKSDWSVRPIVNVIGILRGKEEPGKIVMAGGHRDAWTFGGRDPISGAVSLLETARILGELARQGYRPKRTIAFASWDAEEYGLIGSTEYAEEFGPKLQRELIVYLNRESYTKGDFGAGGVHSLQPFLNEVTKDVRMPDSDQSIFEAWMEKAGEKRSLDYNGDRQVRLGALGSGSDYTAFLDHLGIPSINLGFSSGNGIYHSRYDSHWFFTTYGDPEFKYGEKLSELAALFLLRLANADVLPFDYASSAETIDRYLDELDKEVEKQNLAEEVDLSGIRVANRELAATASVLNGEIRRITAADGKTLRRHRKALRRLNDLLVTAEQAFLDQRGLPGRPWFRHQIYAPGYYTGYGVKTLPGVREAIEKKDVEEVNQMAAVLEQTLDRVRRTLLEAIVVAASIAPGT